MNRAETKLLEKKCKYNLEASGYLRTFGLEVDV